MTKFFKFTADTIIEAENEEEAEELFVDESWELVENASVKEFETFIPPKDEEDTILIKEAPSVPIKEKKDKEERGNTKVV